MNTRKESLQTKVACSKNRVSVPSFLLKTYEMIENKDFDHIICWSRDGTSFVIKNVNKFCQEVLPNYFKHNNFASFVRQLNMYDFHKIRNENNESEFRHKLFRRGSKNMLIEIRRKVNADTNIKLLMENNEGEDSSGMNNNNSNNLSEEPNGESDRIKKESCDLNTNNNNHNQNSNEISTIKQKQQNLEGALNILIQQNEQLLSENKHLWEEIRKNKEKEEKKAEKLFSFMYYLMNSGQILPSTSSNQQNFPAITQGHPINFEQLMKNSPYHHSNNILDLNASGENKQLNHGNLSLYPHDNLNFNKINPDDLSNNDSNLNPSSTQLINPILLEKNQSNQIIKKKVNSHQEWADVTQLQKNEEKIPVCSLSFQKQKKKKEQDKMNSMMRNMLQNIMGYEQNNSDMDLMMRQYQNYYQNFFQQNYPINIPSDGFQPTVNNIHKKLHSLPSKIIPSSITYSGENSPRQGNESPVSTHSNLFKESPINFIQNQIGNNSPFYTPYTPNLSPLLLREYDDMGMPKNMNDSFSGLDK